MSAKLLTLPPLASSSRMYGTRPSSARRAAVGSCPRPPDEPRPEPPRTVKSPAETTARRPPMVTNPVTSGLGVKEASWPSS